MEPKALHMQVLVELNQQLVFNQIQVHLDLL
jgi:hypothetical protein